MQNVKDSHFIQWFCSILTFFLPTLCFPIVVVFGNGRKIEFVLNNKNKGASLACRFFFFLGLFYRYKNLHLYLAEAKKRNMQKNKAPLCALFFVKWGARDFRQYTQNLQSFLSFKLVYFFFKFCIIIKDLGALKITPSHLVKLDESVKFETAEAWKLNFYWFLLFCFYREPVNKTRPCIENFLKASRRCLRAKDQAGLDIALNMIDSAIEFMCHNSGDRIAVSIDRSCHYR